MARRRFVVVSVSLKGIGDPSGRAALSAFGASQRKRADRLIDFEARIGNR
jgi:hypothetical protein